MLAPVDFREFALPYVKRVIAELKKEGIPIIYFANNCAGILKDIRGLGADVIGIDWRIDIADAIEALGGGVVVQGNLDPCALLLSGEEIEERVRDILRKGKGAKGHIFNLGHGILPETPVENVITMVEAVHTYGRTDNRTF
jgi:uroporphyrinogen decarboxylase